MSFINKEVKQKEVADYFADYLNKTNGSDFEATVDLEDRDCDCVLSSKSDPDLRINLQLVMCDSETMKAFSESKKTGKSIGFDPKTEENLKNEILKKSSHYPKALQKELIVIVHSDGSSFNEEYLRNLSKEICDNSDFKNIYYVKPPCPSSNISYPSFPGKVIKLK